MPNFTKNLKLKKPLHTDFYNVADFNENFDALDTAIGAMQQDVDAATAALGNAGVDVVQVTLKAADWTGASGAFIQTVSAMNVVADETKQVIWPIPRSTDMGAYEAFNIKATAQGAAQITFTARCDDQPTSDVVVYIATMGVKQ